MKAVQFPGLFTSFDPHDVPAGGAVEQINCCSLDQGMLQSRPGMRAATFTSGGNTGSGVIALASYRAVSGVGVVYLDDSGSVFLGLNPE